MADHNFIFSMKTYDIDTLSAQAAWMLEKRTELASRKKLPGLWKLTDKLNAVPRPPEVELKRRRESRRRWGGLLLVMGIFLFVPGILKPQELPGPLIMGLLAILLGAWYLRREDRKKNSYVKKAKKLLESMNASMEGKKLRITLKDTDLLFSGIGGEKKIPYRNLECTMETEELFGLVYDNQLVLLQKKELLLGDMEEFRNSLKENTTLLKL